MRASFRQSGQLADHRSGTVVAERPDEQLAPKMPIFSALALYIAERSGSDPVRLNMVGHRRRERAGKLYTIRLWCGVG